MPGRIDDDDLSAMAGFAVGPGQEVACLGDQARDLIVALPGRQKIGYVVISEPLLGAERILYFL